MADARDAAGVARNKRRVLVVAVDASALSRGALSQALGHDWRGDTGKYRCHTHHEGTGLTHVQNPTAITSHGRGFSAI